MDRFLDLILAALGLIYGQRWVVPFVLLPIMAAVAAGVLWRAQREMSGFLKAARLRVQALRAALQAGGDPHAAFASGFMEVATALNAEGPGAKGLLCAWRELRESVFDETEAPIRCGAKAQPIFARAAPRLASLTLWSNVFVGVGLILTFLGLIVALNVAAQGMDGGGVEGAKTALSGLLTVAGAKFFTSVGGLGISIWLRFAEHGLRRRGRAAADEIGELIDQGLVYVPPGRLAAQQLETLKEQLKQAQFFNTELAFQLADRMGAQVAHQMAQVMTPVALSLTQLNDNMTSVTQGIGAGAKEAIEKVSGEQLRSLSDTLAVLGQRLDAITGAVGASGDEAARQIRAAGEDFTRAAADIRIAFDRLAGQVDGMGGRLAQQGEALATAQGEAMTRALGGLEAAHAASAASIGDAVRALQAAGAQAAETLQREVGAALARGVEESQRTFRSALDESGEALRATAAGLTQAVGQAADRIERAGLGISRTGESAARTALAMEAVTGAARTAAQTLGEAATGLSDAAQPVAEALKSVDAAAEKISRAAETNQAAEAEALRALRELADGIRQTHAAAEAAWLSYRARFEGVDKALEQTTVKLGQTLGDSFDQYRRFAQDTDTALAAAVSKLATSLSAIEDYAAALDEHVESVRGPKMEAAE